MDQRIRREHTKLVYKILMNTAVGRKTTIKYIAGSRIKYWNSRHAKGTGSVDLFVSYAVKHRKESFQQMASMFGMLERLQKQLLV